MPSDNIVPSAVLGGFMCGGLLGVGHLLSRGGKEAASVLGNTLGDKLDYRPEVHRALHAAETAALLAPFWWTKHDRVSAKAAAGVALPTAAPDSGRSKTGCSCCDDAPVVFGPPERGQEGGGLRRVQGSVHFWAVV
ncbi:hypothetical protein D9Q98_005383 [Chlorella vulgaris]|uniref:Uncharacterized protein n=1 Tax=Chlorella vulgaris TaxID=3077 RepID=A0A9D4TM51_CHLVU|nr:hypothetical protein D9Q98_005383 [Chlorella vulgaris]